MALKVELFTYPISHYCVSVERMLAFKGIRYTPRHVRYDEKEDLIRRTGQDYSPTLLWGGRTVTWSEIPAFLDRTQPKPSLAPPERAGLARTLENWGHQVLEERVWRAVVTEVPPVLGDEKERWAFEEMQTRARGPWHVLQARKEEFLSDLQPYFGLVDEMLEGHDWILDVPTLADFGIYGSLSPWMTVGRKIPARFKRLTQWAKRVGAL
jgi:glutathione S-transferase